MEIHCKNCDSVVPSSNIDLNGQIAKCDIKLPDGIKIRRDISRLNIERRWLNSKYIFLAFFTVL